MADLLGADQELAEIHKRYECHELSNLCLSLVTP